MPHWAYLIDALKQIQHKGKTEYTSLTHFSHQTLNPKLPPYHTLPCNPAPHPHTSSMHQPYLILTSNCNRQTLRSKPELQQQVLLLSPRKTQLPKPQKTTGRLSLVMNSDDSLQGAHGLQRQFREPSFRIATGVHVIRLFLRG